MHEGCQAASILNRDSGALKQFFKPVSVMYQIRIKPEIHIIFFKFLDGRFQKRNTKFLQNLCSSL